MKINLSLVLLISLCWMQFGWSAEVKKQTRKREKKEISRKISNETPTPSALPSETGMDAPAKRRIPFQNVGAHLGLNMANISGSAAGVSLALDTKIGFLIGVNADYPVNEWFFVRPGLQFIQRGFNYTIPSVTPAVSVNGSFQYLEIPILGVARFNIPEWVVTPFLFVGPNLGFRLSAGCSNSTTSNCVVDTSNLATFQLGLDVGGGLEYGLNPKGPNLTLQICSSSGLTNIDTSTASTISVKNTGIEIIAGARWKLN